MKQTITLSRHEQEAFALFTYFFLQTVAKRHGMVPEEFEAAFSPLFQQPFKVFMEGCLSAIECDGSEPVAPVFTHT